MDASHPSAAFDFELLQRQTALGAGRARRATWWLLGLLAMLVAAVVNLVYYLQRFEADEELRRRTADVQWVMQSARFHFRRLEEDLRMLAQERAGSRDPAAGAMPSGEHAGQLLREPGVVTAHGWLGRQAAGAGGEVGVWLARDGARSAESQAMLQVMLDVASGLHYPTYAGPVPATEDEGGAVWLAVPLFDQGEYAGSYLARLSLRQALGVLVPQWFLADHAVALVDPKTEQASVADAHAAPVLAFLELPGADIALKVLPTGSVSPTVPRTFFVVAMVCLLGMLGSLYALRRDMAKRLRVEMELQAQVALRVAMENAATIGLRAWDSEGRILYVNRSFCRMVGWSPHELVGRQAPLPYWPKDQVSELELVHREVLAQGTERQGVEVQFQHKGGHLIDVLVHEAPLRTADGVQIGWMSSVLDVSERKRAERLAARQQEKLEASGRLVAMGEVASTLAHELNQPLGALSGFANGLINRLRAGRIGLDEVQGVAERMEQLAAKAGRIIQRVNAFARRREMSRQPLELGTFLHRILDPMQRQQPGLWQVHLPSKLMWIEADALLLEHAVLNLLGNAEHWAAQAARLPTVQVSMRTAHGMAELEVCDSGPGVPEEQREQIFSAFHSGKEGGMGMGLAICRSVVEAHHGQIEVGVCDELGGARFCVKIPLCTPPNP
ncbi:two-component system sensor histidine kinase NtrB [Hydrogenophaga aquatica]